MANIINQRKGKFLGYQKYIGVDGVARIEPIFKKKSWQDLTIASTLNTLVKCRVCMGQGFYGNQDSYGLITESYCNHCGGTGEMISV